MRNLTIFLIALCSMVSFGQSENDREVIINETQLDDTYKAGESVTTNASIQGDLVIAGGTLIVNDSVMGDLTAAGGELFINTYVADDVRVAAGRVTIDSEIGDDLVVFGGEVTLTENAKINGNLKCYSGSIKMKGNVVGNLDVKGADVLIDGTVYETSKIVGDDITIGSNAKFHKDVQYWNSDGELDFKATLVNSEAEFNEALSVDSSPLSLTTFGTNSIKLWISYILSALLVIIVVHALFKNSFSGAAEGIKRRNLLKSFGFGLIYLIGIPLMIVLTFLIAVGIPLGLFAAAVFVFSLLFGHMVASLLIVYFMRQKNNKNWSFWNITFLALLCTVVLRIITMVPYAGIVLSIVLLAITYGALTLNVLHPKKTVS